MPPTMRGNPIHSYKRPPCPRLSPAPIPVITASRLTPASFIASIARRVPSENTVTLRRKAAALQGAASVAGLGDLPQIVRDEIAISEIAIRPRPPAQRFEHEHLDLMRWDA